MKTYFFELPPVLTVALEVIAGKYGVGDERKKALQSEGYDYDKIQRCVNDLLGIVNKYES